MSYEPTKEQDRWTRSCMQSTPRVAKGIVWRVQSVCMVSLCKRDAKFLAVPCVGDHLAKHPRDVTTRRYTCTRPWNKNTDKNLGFWRVESPKHEGEVEVENSSILAIFIFKLLELLLLRISVSK
jgi:hypothetical protein